MSFQVFIDGNPGFFRYFGMIFYFFSIQWWQCYCTRVGIFWTENSVQYSGGSGFCRFGMRSIGKISYCLRKAWTVTFPVNLSPVSGTGPAEIHLFSHILELSLYNRWGIAAEKLSAATPSVCGFWSTVGPFPTMFSVQISRKVCCFT